MTEQLFDRFTMNAPRSSSCSFAMLILLVASLDSLSSQTPQVIYHHHVIRTAARNNDSSCQSAPAFDNLDNFWQCAQLDCHYIFSITTSTALSQHVDNGTVQLCFDNVLSPHELLSLFGFHGHATHSSTHGRIGWNICRSTFVKLHGGTGIFIVSMGKSGRCIWKKVWYVNVVTLKTKGIYPWVPQL